MSAPVPAPRRWTPLPQVRAMPTAERLDRIVRGELGRGALLSVVAHAGKDPRVKEMLVGALSRHWPVRPGGRQQAGSRSHKPRYENVVDGSALMASAARKSGLVTIGRHEATNTVLLAPRSLVSRWRWLAATARSRPL